MRNAESVKFAAFSEATREDFELIAVHDAENASRNADRVLGWLRLMEGPSPYQVSRLEHCLQSATRAETDGAGDEMIAVALLHDVGDEIAPLNHSQVAAAVLRPYVSEKSWWIVQHHGLFQGYYWFEFFDRDKNERDRYMDSPHYDACAQFCADWDSELLRPVLPEQAARALRAPGSRAFRTRAPPPRLGSRAHDHELNSRPPTVPSCAQQPRPS